VIPVLGVLLLFAAFMARDSGAPPETGVEVSSVGDWIPWTPTPDELRLEVPDSTLRIFSPGIALESNLDERFDVNRGAFACLILEKDGQRSLHPFGLEARHRWVEFEFGTGSYRLRFRTKGKIRNDVRFAPGVRVFARQATLGIRQGEDREVARLEVTPKLIGKTVRVSNFDADDELVIRLETPDGSRLIPSSGEGVWSGRSFVVTPSSVGTWNLWMANPGRQGVNSVTLRVTGLEAGFEILPRR
jgi:hypothetical protein